MGEKDQINKIGAIFPHFYFSIIHRSAVSPYFMAQYGLCMKWRRAVYSIIVIDDEPTILQGVRSAVAWAEYGFETVISANSAAEALALMEKYHFDIMITDICMPNKSGLELIKETRQRYPEMHSVILTAYSEFDYVLEALHLGVDNYLLKPINPQELISTIQHSLERIEQEQKRSRRDEQVSREYVLQRWITGDLQDDELDHRCQIHHINLYSRYYDLILLQQTDPENPDEYMAGEVREILQKHFDCYELSSKNQNQIFIIGGRNITSEMVANLLKPAVNGKTADIIIGQPVSGAKRVSACYSELKEIALYSSLLEEKPLQAEKIRHIFLQLTGSHQIEQIRDIFLQKTPQSMEIKIAEYVRDFLSTSQMNSSKPLFPIIIFLSCLFRQMDSEQILGDKLISFQKELIASVPARMKKTDFKTLLQEFVIQTQQFLDNNVQEISPIIQRVLNYIEQNWNQPLSIKSISQILSSNPSYLGYLFKKETGIFFSDYLNQFRIRKAETLLLHTDYTINDISTMIGYTNVTYFNQIFKKMYQVSPAKYRQMKKTES